jgi:hypothetical protein
MAGIDAAVAWIDDHERLVVGRPGRLRHGGGRQRLRLHHRLQGHPVIGSPVGAREFDDEQRRLPERPVLDALDERRLREVDDDARAAGGEETEAIGRDEPCPLAPGIGWQLEVHLWQVDDDTVGPLQQESPGLNGARNGQAQAGGCAVRLDLGRHSHGRPRGRRRRILGFDRFREDKAERAEAEREQPRGPAAHHRLARAACVDADAFHPAPVPPPSL